MRAIALAAALVLSATATLGEGLIVRPARLWETLPVGEARTFEFRLFAESGDLPKWTASLESFVLDSDGRPARLPPGPPSAPFRIASVTLEPTAGTLRVAFTPASDDHGSFWVALVLTGPPVRQEWIDGAVMIDPIVVVPLVVTTGEARSRVEIQGLESFRTAEGIEVSARLQNGETALRLTPYLVLEKVAEVPIECSVVPMTPLVLLPGDARVLRFTLPDDPCAERILLVLPGQGSGEASIRHSSPAS